MFQFFAPSTRQRFVRDERGGVAMIFGVFVLVIGVVAGAALDFSRSVTVKVRLAGALDAAVLDVARGLTLGVLDRESVGEELNRMFQANVVGSLLEEFEPAIDTVAFDEANSTIQATATSTVPAALIQLAGIDTMDVGVSSAATFNDNKVEIAMMLDLTGSMNQGGKLAAMKDAAELAVKTIMPTTSQADPDKVRIALIPYSQGVNAGRYARRATNNVSRKCATERNGTEAYTNVGPGTVPLGNGSSECPPSKIMPLESDPQALKNRIRSFRASGYTSGNVGIAWTWYTLSNTWNTVWGAGSAAQPKSNKVHKYAILMTDGEFNTVYDLKPNGKYEEITKADNKDYAIDQSNERAVELCDAMKQSGVVVFTVAFELKAKTAIDTLKACSSDTSYTTFFDAASADELEAAYLEIASRIQNMWLSN